MKPELLKTFNRASMSGRQSSFWCFLCYKTFITHTDSWLPPFCSQC